MKTSFLRFGEFAVMARDGEVGRVRDIYFDDLSWKVRYLVVDTRRWLGGRRVLVSPQSVESLNPGRREIALDLTREQVEASPPHDDRMPLTKELMAAVDQHYGWAHYWITGGPISFSFPTVNYGPIAESFDIPSDVRTMIEERYQRGADTIVGFRDVIGWHVETVDDDRAGTVRDAVLNYQDWTLPYLVVDTGHWVPGRKVVLPASFVESFEIERHALAVRTSAESLATAPRFDVDGFGMEDERLLVEHYFDRMEPGWLTSSHRRGDTTVGDEAPPP